MHGVKLRTIKALRYYRSETTQLPQSRFDSPQVVTQVFGIAEIGPYTYYNEHMEDSVCIDFSPVYPLNVNDCVHDTNENIATWTDLAILRQ